MIRLTKQKLTPKLDISLLQIKQYSHNSPVLRLNFDNKKARSMSGLISYSI
ncbi:hypothetical protein VAE151_560865 [Vibrio aestuarianus]|uniref:Uncharacterized protein n=1 Tax=Vibrio aestuarianus TaxID=28171 RepID=A0ABM9FT63_9VIBR|nr:hypothetical protein VAE308_1051510 [Vibrio aestuarianus]CAH8210516.1 hypothetical protein VIBAE_A32101 [Vibrio aestuarianus subsp. francensis]CAH8210050.1 hypothetical protein VAEU17_310038 [Vibrio aestuarianus]CAH8211507.1 hypothetical protein VAE055_380857 [Vibrio aestuarianus]CAH8211713.1 hypothetical protein VAE128_461509 [Vibrio aestuarianus]